MGSALPKDMKKGSEVQKKVSGFSVQVSGKYRGPRSVNKWQKTKGRLVSVICYLTP